LGVGLPPRPSGTAPAPGAGAQEAELTAGVVIAPGRSYGFFIDTTVCIGGKACEVACKEWNAPPADEVGLTGHSYDNTGHLSATTWRHVAFVEQLRDGHGERATTLQPFQSHWLMMSDVCKHCSPAPCLEACPTGAIFRTEFDTVVVQPGVCNGCGYCVPACPFGVVDLNLDDGKAHKCTLCYDRLKGCLESACAYRVGFRGLGVLTPLTVYGISLFTRRRSRRWSIAAAVATLAGGYLLRSVSVFAGNTSARRPRDYLRFTQPRR
jgi:formate dehydrogenase iron-sulfur subunit